MQFSGYTPDQTFALSSDGEGGTDITVGVPAPTLATLAALDSATYGPLTGVGVIAEGYTVVADAFDTAGLYVEAFQDDNQIVVAIRGTDLNSLYTLAKNMGFIPLTQVDGEAGIEV